VGEMGSRVRPDAQAMSEQDRFRIVVLVAAFVGLLFVGIHIWQTFALGSIESLVLGRGGTVPPPVVTLVGLNRLGLLPVVVVLIDVGVFMLMMQFARRYWVGLLFAPLFVYVALIFIYQFAITTVESL
jgi:hypothetical protein